MNVHEEQWRGDYVITTQ